MKNIQLVVIQALAVLYGAALTAAVTVDPKDVVLTPTESTAIQNCIKGCKATHRGNGPAEDACVARCHALGPAPKLKSREELEAREFVGQILEARDYVDRILEARDFLDDLAHS